MNAKKVSAVKQSRAVLVKSGVRAGGPGHPARHGQSPNHSTTRLRVKSAVRAGSAAMNNPLYHP